MLAQVAGQALLSVAGDRPPTLPLTDGLLLCLRRAAGASSPANVTVLDDCSSAVWACGSVTAHAAHPGANRRSDRASDCCACSRPGCGTSCGPGVGGNG